jgi:hypothetical protein
VLVFDTRTSLDYIQSFSFSQIMISVYMLVLVPCSLFVSLSVSVLQNSYFSLSIYVLSAVICYHMHYYNLLSIEDLA